MAGALVSIIKEQAQSILQEEFKLIVGVDDELRKISTTLNAIQGVLKDAEERQVKDKPVKVWLDELKDFSYNIDDVLDEWRTRILGLQIEVVDNSALVRKVCTSLHCFCLDEDVLHDTIFFLSRFGFNQLILRHKIAHSIKDIRNRLDVIADEKNKYNFNISESIKELDQRIITSSVVDISEVYGRALDKEAIISKLLSESSHQIKNEGLPIISIVGMGGLGKTTLAQLVFNDDKVKAHFGKTIWVCVSDPFDKARVAKEIIGVIGEHDPNVPSWDALHQCLCKSIKGKQFLLVLDDVWTDKYQEWEPLRVSLKLGAPGSRVVVTTRNQSVAIMMGSVYTRNLETLSKDDTWSLLGGVALFGRREEERRELEEVGKKIALKCKGLPLAAKTLGSLLRFKRTKRDWLNVLESETWNLEGIKKDVLPALLLSYYDLPSHLKCCLEYCAIFPKDKEIWKDELIELWMAQGFLGLEGEEEMERVGGEYYDNLVMRSFLNSIYVHKVDNVQGCNMHDLVHDFVQCLTKGDCLIVEKDADRSLVELGWFERTRHLTLGWENAQDIVPSISKAINLRTLRGFKCISGGFFPISFCNLKCLRSLDLSCSKIERLPNEIGKLIHLRYLDLSKTPIKELPEAVTKLYNLLTLDVSFCRELVKLPQRVENLRKMRHFRNHCADQLTYLPKGIGRLCSLRTLEHFIVSGDGDGCKIHELKNLNHLSGMLMITGLGNITKSDEAREANLRCKHKLRDLLLKFDGDAIGGGEEIGRCRSVLEGLQLPLNLNVLGIGDYPGTKFPKHWMTVDNRSIISTNLRVLTIYDCKNCLRLSLPMLPSLARISIEGLEDVRYMGRKFFEIRDDDDNEHDDDEEDDIKIMPKLGDLYIARCIKLKVLPRLSHTTLRKLCVENCPSLTWTLSCIQLPLLEELTLWGEVGDLGRSLAPTHIYLPTLKSLSIVESPHSSLPEGLCHLTILRDLRIQRCDNIKNLSEELKPLDMVQNLEVTNRSREQEKKLEEELSKLLHIPQIFSTINGYGEKGQR